jgi:hypothetical protein
VTGGVADRDPYGNRHADDKANSLKSDRAERNEGAER